MAPSDIVVTDRQSLAANFAENSKQVLCSAAFGAGAYAIGGSLLGFPPLTPAAALVTGGALLTSLALCPSGSEDSIFGQPPAFSGGQCDAVYNFEGQTNSYQDVGGAPGGRPIRVLGIRGPVTIQNGLLDGLQPPSTPIQALRFVGADGRVFDAIFESYGHVPGSLTGVFSRTDGLPDNCGNAPNSGGQVIRNSESGDTIDNSTVVNNSDYSLTIPVVFNLGGINNTLNLKFGDIRIGSLLPLSFKINIGGADFEFGENPDGILEPRETNPDEEGTKGRTEELLKKIRECVCKPDVDMDLLYLPLVGDATSCDIVSAEFLVPKGSVDAGVVDSFLTSASLANVACNRLAVEQLPESQIFAATVTAGGAEVFTGIIGPEVVSLRVVITSFDENILPKISLYPDSNQRKFGSVNYCGDGGSGGGDYIYVFDNSTFVPLPKRAKNGRLRILFKPGTSFTIYDTGERF